MWRREKTSTMMAVGPCSEATWGAGRAGCISNEGIQLLHRDQDPVSQATNSQPFLQEPDQTSPCQTVQSRWKKNKQKFWEQACHKLKPLPQHIRHE